MENKTTLNHIIYDILGTLRGGTLGGIEDDDLLLADHVKFKVHNTRAYLIRQDLNKGNAISDNILQSLCCVEMQIVNSSECPELPSDCKIYRSILEIPQFLETDFSDTIISVRNSDILADTFSVMSMSRAVQATKYPGRVKIKGSIAFFKSRYLYVINYPKLLKYVCLDAVYDNPEEVWNFQVTSGVQCEPVEQRYPISQWMIKPLSDIIVDYFRKGIQGTDGRNDNELKLEPTAGN